jgi:cytochrome c peroxidase
LYLQVGNAVNFEINRLGCKPQMLWQHGWSKAEEIGKMAGRITDQSRLSSASWIISAGLAIALLGSCERPAAERQLSAQLNPAPSKIEIPFGLPDVEQPANNPLTDAKVALGRRLFFDPNLSSDRTVSCASCHDPNQSWTNGQKYGVGVGGIEGTRNVPSILNVAYFRQLFWDGRAGSLEAQALFPLLSPAEMAMPSREAILERLQEDSAYEPLFAAAFADGTTVTNMAMALACYERTILAGNAPYDRYVAGDKDAMSAAAVRGLEVFLGRGKCSGCHVPPRFLDYSFYNLGVGMESTDPDLGRYHVFKMDSAKGKFKTPTLRDIALTAPYMHDGSISTLRETVEIYDQGGIRNRYLSNEVQRPLRLTEQEKQDLIIFLSEGLTSDDKPKS